MAVVAETAAAPPIMPPSIAEKMQSAGCERCEPQAVRLCSTKIKVFGGVQLTQMPFSMPFTSAM